MEGAGLAGSRAFRHALATAPKSTIRTDQNLINLVAELQRRSRKLHPHAKWFLLSAERIKETL